MKNLQLIGCLCIVAGSFLPLLKIPVIGNWNYYQINPYLAICCWIFCAFALLGIVKDKIVLVKFSAIVLLFLFIITLVGIKIKALDFFNFIPFKSWQNWVANTVKLGWAWILEFAGAALMLFSKNQSAISRDN